MTGKQRPRLCSWCGWAESPEGCLNPDCAACVHPSLNPSWRAEIERRLTPGRTPDGESWSQYARTYKRMRGAE